MNSWNLTHLYASIEDWNTDFDKVKNQIDYIKNYEGKLYNFDKFLEYYKLQKDIYITAVKVYQYAKLESDLDQRNVENNSKVQRVMHLFNTLYSNTSFESPEIKKIGKIKIFEFIKQNSFLEEYKFSFEKLFRLEKYILDEKSEKLLSHFSPLTNSLSNIYSSLSVADLVNKEITISTNETITITSGNYRSYLADLKNPKDRKIVFEAVFNHYNTNKSTYASIYNSILQNDVSLMKTRNYNSSLDLYLYKNNIPTKVFDSLINVSSSNTESIKRYYKIRKEYLKLETHNSYDRFIPLSKESSKYTYEEAKNLFFKSIEKFDEEFKSKAKDALKPGYVDVKEKEGKQTGAYSSSVANEHPFILLNFDKTLNSVFTLAHEAGHSIHSLFTNENQSVQNQNYTIFVAEIASTFNEHNLLDYIIENTKTSKEEKIHLLQQSIDDILGTFHRQVLFATYELEAHKLAEQGIPITHESLSNIMINLYKKYYDIDISKEDSKQYVWAYIPHLFYTPFYVYQYATSFAISLALYEDVKKGKPNALNNYKNLLKSGGSDYPTNQVLKAGIDISDKNTYMAVVNRLNDLVEQLSIAINE